MYRLHKDYLFTIAINLQTFDECVEKRQPDCNPDNMWLQIPFLCGHVAACWYVYTIKMLQLTLQKTSYFLCEPL